MQGDMVVSKSVLEVWENVGFFDEFVKTPNNYTFCDFTEATEEANRPIARGLVKWFDLFWNANDPSFRKIVMTHQCIDYVATGYYLSFAEGFKDFGIRPYLGALLFLRFLIILATSLGDVCSKSWLVTLKRRTVSVTC